MKKNYFVLGLLLLFCVGLISCASNSSAKGNTVEDWKKQIESVVGDVEIEYPDNLKKAKRFMGDKLYALRKVEKVSYKSPSGMIIDELGAGNFLLPGSIVPEPDNSYKYRFHFQRADYFNICGDIGTIKNLKKGDLFFTYANNISELWLLSRKIVVKDAIEKSKRGISLINKSATNIVMKYRGWHAYDSNTGDVLGKSSAGKRAYQGITLDCGEETFYSVMNPEKGSLSIMVLNYDDNSLTEYELLYVGNTGVLPFIENQQKKVIEKILDEMIEIPGTNLKFGKTEVPQILYKVVMEVNPSSDKGEHNPVENVSWYDAIYFCNKLSEKAGFTPVYAVDGITNVNEWNYIPHKEKEIGGKITQRAEANGFRLPTLEEWQFAAKGGEEYKYAGSDNLDEVGWYEDNSEKKIHPVSQKISNGYELYYMNGQVGEWVWDVYPNYSDGRYVCGGGYYDHYGDWKVDSWNYWIAYGQNSSIGFRIVCSSSN